jgi:uncharacterized membrane protein YkoI
MVRTTDKIVLGVFVVLFLGLASVFITALNSDSGVSGDVVSSSQISEAKAVQVAQSAVSGNLQGVQSPIVNGEKVYEVELISNSGTEIEVLVSLNGDILDIEYEEDEEELSSNQLKSIDGIISESEAEEIALNEVGSGRVIEVEAEREGGRLLYEVEIKDGVDIVEVEIDAETGEVLEVEVEDEDDDD